MAEEVRIAVYENGELSVPVKGGNRNEAVLALPLDRLLVKVVKVPGELQDDIDGYLFDVFKKLSPYPDEPIKVSYETVRETEDARIVLAAALPEGSTDDIAEALDGAKLNVTRVDSWALGVLRVAWPRLGISSDQSRRAVLISGASCVSLFVLDGDSPAVVRAIAPGADLKRELVLSLVEADSFAGSAPLAEILVIGGGIDTSAVEAFAPVRPVDDSAFDPLAGIVERALDPSSLNALPESWREVLEESRFKSKFKMFAAAALAVWVAMLSVIIGVPKYYAAKTADQNEIIRRNHQRYREVQQKKDQVKAVRNVSNHDLGALESLRVVASAMPDGLVLSRWNFKRGDILTFTGTSESGNHQRVYDFKDQLSSIKLSQISGLDDDAEVGYFTRVELPRGVATRGTKASFDVECDFKQPEESN